MNQNFYVLALITLASLFMVMKNNPEYSDNKIIESVKINLQKQWLYMAAFSGLIQYGIYKGYKISAIEIYFTLFILFMAIPVRHSLRGKLTLVFVISMWGWKLIFG